MCDQVCGTSTESDQSLLSLIFVENKQLAWYGLKFNIHSSNLLILIAVIGIIPANFLPFGTAHGDSRVPTALVGSTEAIPLGTDVVIFGSHHNTLYVSYTYLYESSIYFSKSQVNTNGVLSFRQSFPRFYYFGSDFDSVSSPPIIAPFWDLIDIRASGTIYYRQDFNSSIADQIQQDIYTQFPDVGFFYPSLVFVATWDRVAEYFGFSDRNTFQVVLASDGGRTFVRFNYGDIQWGGFRTLIGVSAGDRVNFITHPASQSSSVLLLDDTTTTYRIDSKW